MWSSSRTFPLLAVTVAAAVCVGKGPVVPPVAARRARFGAVVKHYVGFWNLCPKSGFVARAILLESKNVKKCGK